MTPLYLKISIVEHDTDANGSVVVQKIYQRQVLIEQDVNAGQDVNKCILKNQMYIRVNIRYL